MIVSNVFVVQVNVDRSQDSEQSRKRIRLIFVEFRARLHGCQTSLCFSATHRGTFNGKSWVTMGSHGMSHGLSRHAVGSHDMP